MYYITEKSINNQMYTTYNVTTNLHKFSRAEKRNSTQPLISKPLETSKRYISP